MKAVKVGVASLLSMAAYGSALLPPTNDKRQSAGSFYAITGATGGVFPRMEIRDLEKAGGEMWNLFLLAMTDFQAMDQNIIDSWYQIAGIHGMPWQPWDGVQGSTDDRTVGQMGYCPHNQLLFATWHRPYLALFEQKLQQVATGIANKFPTATRSKYQDAAIKLRLPYWDWAKALPTDQPVVPTALSVQSVSVTFPNSSAATIDNPLFDYNFHPLDHTQINGTGCPTFGGPGGATGGLPSVCDNSQSTIRASDSKNDNDALSARLRNILASQRSYLYNILSQYQTFTQFTSAATCDGPARVGNIETLHNPIHTLNFPGHMSPSSVTAFDPMFWMHHANVDRQFALYQAVFPDTYLGSCSADTPTYTINEGDTLDANSPLTPFHKNAAGDFWTAASSRNTRDMGYTYPELASNPKNATLVASIKAQYSGPADVLVTTKSKVKTKRADGPPTKQEKYLAEVKLPTYGLDDGAGGASPYNVLLFLGDVPSNTKTWQGSESFVGMASTLGGLHLKIDQIVPATVDLSLALQKAIDNKATTEDKAEEYLKQNLHFRLGLGDAEIPKAKVAGLEVSLISTEVEVATSDDTFDRWVGGFKEHGKIDS